MRNDFNINWWALLLRGIASIIFGILAFVWPAVALLSLVFVFGAYAIVDGVLAIIAGLRSPKGAGRWWMLVLVGVLGLAAGAVSFLLPGLTAFSLLMLIAAWALVTGILEIIAAVQLRKEITGEWLMILGGAFSVLFGLLLFIDPTAGAVAVVWIIAFYAIVYGVLLTTLGWKVRKLEHTHHPATPRHA